MRHGGRLVRSGGFDPFPCALGIVRFVRVRRFSGSLVCVRVRPLLGSFPCGLDLAVFVRVRSVDSRAPCGSLEVFGYIPVRTGCRRVRSVYSRASWGPSGSVQSIPVHPGGCLLCLGAFGTFPCAQGVVLFVCVCPFSYAV